MSEHTLKLDVLAVAAHPDDAELGCGGTLALLAGQGKAVGILDLTRGELGSRGTPAVRHTEATHAAEILGLCYRENMGLPDGFFQNDPATQREVIRYIRHTRPDVLLINAPEDRHPDHGRAHALLTEASFLAGLVRIATEWNGSEQAPWRPLAVAAYVQDRYLEPTFCVPLSPEAVQLKMAAVRAYASQFYNPVHSTQHPESPETYISSPEFLEWIGARMAHFGHRIGHRWAEGFVTPKGPLALPSPLALLPS
jgi:bacillithiol biosynthesis deacetylase BshB1